MPATPERIAFVQQDFRSAVWTDPSMQALYGKVARDTGPAPVDTFFDDMAAVEAMVQERGAILGKHARAFVTKVDELVDLSGPFAFATALPGVRVIDPELVADLACAAVSIQSYDTGAEQTVLASWGVLGGPAPSPDPDNVFANSMQVRANNPAFAASLAEMEQRLGGLGG